MSDSGEKMGFNATWSMAVGGMVGGGIFSTLGVVISIAGPWAWFSFLVGGLIALASGYSFAKLASVNHEGGGVFIFLRKVHANSAAGTIAWILIVGYVLTSAVYAFTFGEYLSYVIGGGPWFVRAAALAMVAFFVALNLRGVGDASSVEIVLVWFKLVVLVGLALWGLWLWDVPMLSKGVQTPGLPTALFAAAAVYMAYEGFELLSYDYEDIEDADRTLPRATLSAIITVIIVYVIVALGTAMLIGADKIVANEEVAIAIAGKQVAGMFGLIVVTIAASFSTGSAINATLFSTARFTRKVAEDDELPRLLDKSNKAGVPEWALIGVGTCSAILVLAGSLTSLVSSASLAFLLTFALVCGLAFKEKAGLRIVTGAGAIGGVLAAIGLIYRLWMTDPIALAFLAVLAVIAAFGRPFILKHLKTE